MMASASALLHAAAIQSAKTYPEFQAYIAAQATGGYLSTVSSVGSSIGAFRFTLQPETPGYAPLIGSPWGPLSPNGVSGSYSYWFGVICHSMPTAEVFNAVRAVSGEVMLRVEDGGIASPAYDTYPRNGITSTAAASSSTYVRHITELLAYVPGEGPIRMQPKLGLGPASLTW